MAEYEQRRNSYSAHIRNCPNCKLKLTKTKDRCGWKCCDKGLWHLIEYEIISAFCPLALELLKELEAGL